MAAGAHRYTKSETNPNDSIGGAGCFCGYSRCEDRGGPYFVSQAIETDNGLSPYVVVCHPCSVGMATSDAEALPLGEPVPEGHEPAVEVPPAPRAENPVAEGHYPTLDDPDDELAI